MEPKTMGSSSIPQQVTLVVCPACGRKGFSHLDVRPNHWHHGARCSGTPESVVYRREGDDRSEWPDCTNDGCALKGRHYHVEDADGERVVWLDGAR